MRIFPVSFLSILPVVRTRGKPLTRLFSTEIKEQIVSIDGYKINYAKGGNGEHTLLLLPGGLGTIETDFKPQLTGLDKTKYTLVAWDPPGYGKSRPPERNFTTDFFRRDADLAGKLMEKLGYKKYSVLGWSDGGITGLILAAIRNNHVQKLISLAANSYLSEADLKIMQSIKDVSTWSERMRRPMEEIYGKEYFPKLVSSWCNTFSEINEKNGGDICRSYLPNITAPTLIIQGDKDAMVPLEHSEYLFKNIPNSKLHIFKGGKHNLHLRYPEEFNSIVDGFLSSS